MMNAQAGGTYLYAVLPHTQGGGEPGSTGVEDAEVYRVIAGDLAAVVSRVSRPRLRPERRHLLAHQAMLRRLMEHGSVLPATFGVVAPSDEAVRDRLLEGHEQLREQLARVSGKVEMGLKVSWSDSDIFGYFVTAHPELTAARDQLLAHPELSREELINVGKLFEHLREAERESHFERVAAVLREQGVELKQNPPRGEREVMNLACLVPRERADAFEKMIEVAARGFDDHFTFEFNGPWAPHSFTELEPAARSGRV